MFEITKITLKVEQQDVITNSVLSTFADLRNVDETAVTCLVHFVTPQRAVQVYPRVLAVVQ